MFYLPAKGVAILVPLKMAKLPRGTGNVLRMLPPYEAALKTARDVLESLTGAASAGLKNMSLVGPKDVKLSSKLVAEYFSGRRNHTWIQVLPLQYLEGSLLHRFEGMSP